MAYLRLQLELDRRFAFQPVQGQAERLHFAIDDHALPGINDFVPARPAFLVR
jgi:hypothetical protein